MRNSRRAYPVTGSLQVKHDRSPLYLKPGQPGDTSTPFLLPTAVSAISAQPTGPSSDCLSVAQTGAQSSLAGWPESCHLQIRPFRSIDLLRTVVAPAYSTTQIHNNTDTDSEQTGTRTHICWLRIRSSGLTIVKNLALPKPSNTLPSGLPLNCRPAPQVDHLVEIAPTTK
jgi:hypothetical protein